LTSYWDQGSVANLGAVYSDAAGNLTAGAWQVSPGGSVLVSQHVDGVDTKVGTMTSHYYGCTQSNYSDCPAILGAASKAPLSIHPALAISPDGSSVALTTDALYVQRFGSGSVAQVAGAGWTCPPAWSPDSKHVAVTQVTSQTTDASGVLRSTTNVLSATGSSSATFVGGAQNLAWFYSS
jgi:hypothetical protein